MKKQIYQFTVFITSLAILSPLGTIFSTQKSYAAPAKCYTVIGEMSVAPTTSGCSVDQFGRIVYFNQSGTLIDRPADDACYAGAPATGEGTFQSRTFNEQSCTDLNNLMLARRQQLCEASDGSWTAQAGTCSCPAGEAISPITFECRNSQGVPTTESECVAAGGTWKSVGTASGGVEYGFYCQVSTTGSGSGSGAGGDIDIRETRESDCRSPNNEDLTEDNCGIIALLNTVFNLVSGGVSLAVIGNIIVAGIQYSSAQGDPGAAAKAKTRIRNALLAFLMYLSLYGFIQWLIPGGVF